MPLKFNPFTAQFDLTGSGGGGGGASYLDGEVAVYADLSLDAGVAPLNSAWLVRTASGVWPVSRKQAGIYIRTATGGSSRDADYTYAGTMPDVFSDSVFLLYDEASTTRTGQFNLGSITAGQNRVLTWPDGNGTIARTSDIPSTFAASAITSGVFDNARINFAAPDSIGSTTRNSGSFTTLNANTSITGPIGATVGSTSAPAIVLGHSNSGIYVSSNQIIFTKQGVECMFFDNSARVNVNTASGLQIVQTDAPIIFSRAISLFPDATNGALAQRSGTQAQEYRVYATHTSSTNYQRMTVKSVRQTLSALSGASATTTGTFIPDGAVVVGVTTRVATLLTGAAGYTIGDGTDADRWGDITGTAVGTTSDNRDWTAGTIECFTAGGNITLTAKTSNFTAGAIEICVFYLAGEAD